MKKLMSRMVVVLTIAILILTQSSIHILASSNAEDEIKKSELFSKSCVLMDGDSGRVLFDKNRNEPLANASTTKILTCIVALENGMPDGVVTASANACGQPKVHLGMQTEERFYLKDLLYALMLESFNDCAVAIAEYISGTTEDFARLMNAKAEEIGCMDTYFITPNGLDAKDEVGFHHTTAEDLCRIMRYCAWESAKKTEFLEITQTQSYAFTDLNGKGFSCNNHNAFLTMMDGVISGKTGFTGDAGYCYVAALEKDGKKYCIALLACGWPNNRTYKWKDAKKLFTYGLEYYEKKNISQIPELNDLKIENGRLPDAGFDDWQKEVLVSPYVDVNGEKEVNYLVNKDDKWQTKVCLQRKNTAPIRQHQEIGKIVILLNNQCVREYKIRANICVEKWSFRYLMKCLGDEFFL